MPIFEYVCGKCGKVFEKLILGKSQEPLVCPDCGSKQVEQKFSTFSSSSAGTRSAPTCAPSGGG
jgi:putative FmdB family regulatory protein